MLSTQVFETFGLSSNPSRRATKEVLQQLTFFHFLELMKVRILLPLRRDGVADSTTKKYLDFCWYIASDILSLAFALYNPAKAE